MNSGKQIKPGTLNIAASDGTFEAVSNKTTSMTTNSNTKYPTEAAVKAFVGSGGMSKGCAFAFANNLFTF